MEKITSHLLLLVALIWSNNGYTWSCSFSNGEDGWYLEDSMVCTGIDPQVALEQEYCTWFRPNDPICSEILQPVCVDAIEYKTESCPQNYSGGLQYSRQYLCNLQAWSDWSLSSDNCSPNPPSCIEASESRVMACPSGYEGQITETRISNCPDPYGDPVWLEWQQSESTCTQSVSDPVSPISVTSPTNPVTSTAIESVTVPQIDAQQTTNEPTIESVAQEELTDSGDEVESSTSDKADSTENVKENKEDGNEEKSKDNVDNVVDNSKEIVHGFGLALSLDVLNKPMEFYQPPLNDMFSISQEFPVEQRIIEELYGDVFRQDYIEDYYIRFSDNTWKWLRRRDILE